MRNSRDNFSIRHRALKTPVSPLLARFYLNKSWCCLRRRRNIYSVRS